MDERAERLDEGWDLLEEDDPEGALACAEEALERDARDPEALHLAGVAQLEMGDAGAARESLEACLRADGSNLDAAEALAAAFYESCRFDEGLARIERVLREDPDSAYGHNLRGLLLDMTGRRAEADAAFARAARLDPEGFSLPLAMDRSDFDAAVRQALDGLPAEFRERVSDLPIVVEEVPSGPLLATLDRPTPDLLGLFVGTPLPDRTHADAPTVPDAIYLFKRNLERACDGREALVEEIRVTLLHEIGHYLGMEEKDLEDAGYA